MFFDDEHESRLRRLAKDMYKGKKGAMVKVASEGIDMLERERKRQWGFERLLHEAKNAKKWSIGEFSRDEAYE